MILFVTTARHRYTLKQIIPGKLGRGAGRVVSYDWLFTQSSIRASAVVFTDFDRLRHYELVAAAAIYRQLRDQGVRVLNDPAKARQRFDLLHCLAEAGINRFRAYKAALGPKPKRFPVFVKCESNHVQDFPDLIADQAALDCALGDIEDAGASLRDLLVIEFANSPIRESVYLRKTVYRIGDRILSGNPVVEDGPFVKYGTLGLAVEDDFERLADWMRNNPELEALGHVFDLARIEYGRADYGIDGDGLAIYEINTNPQIGLSVPKVHAGFHAASMESVEAVVNAIRALGGDTKTARIVHNQAWFSRFEFHAGFVLKMP